jgi:hypothetical protein
MAMYESYRQRGDFGHSEQILAMYEAQEARDAREERVREANRRQMPLRALEGETQPQPDLRGWRDLAAREALVDRPRQRQEAFVKKLLKPGKRKSLEPIKDCIKMARKPKMRTVEQYLCDNCDSIIPNSTEEVTEGFVIHGNIYVADPSKRSGIIGNNIPDVAEGEKIEPAQVKQTVLCKTCLMKALFGINESKYKKPSDMKEDDFRGILDGLNIDSMVAQDRPRRRGRSSRLGEVSINFPADANPYLPGRDDGPYDDGGGYTT